MGHILKSVLGLAAVAVFTSGFAGLADAASCKGRHCKVPRYGDEPGVYRFVTARQTFGGAIVAAPVRHGRWGDEVRIPGGDNWADCEITCEYTLRRLSVDFWDGMGSQTVSPGYFRFDFDPETGGLYRRGPAFLGRY
ncbi:MAG: hypothetical protein WBP94_00515 [Rhodomicrobiaceae bacterium]